MTPVNQCVPTAGIGAADSDSPSFAATWDEKESARSVPAAQKRNSHQCLQENDTQLTFNRPKQRIKKILFTMYLGGCRGLRE